MKTRHCLPSRVRAMLAALNGQSSVLATLIRDGCACPNQASCVLGFACERIHRAFETDVQGIA